LPEGSGALWLCGKHFVGPDVGEAMRSTGATTVVCLNESSELEQRYPAYVEWLRTDPRAHWHPIPDLHAPPVSEARQLVTDLRHLLDEGETLLVHCGAGIGRAGTIAVGVLLTYGIPLGEALATVAAHRPLAGPEAGPQRELLAALDTW
jgi:protein-tyrosine phosphatase